MNYQKTVIAPNDHAPIAYRAPLEHAWTRTFLSGSFASMRPRNHVNRRSGVLACVVLASGVALMVVAWVVCA